MLKPSEVNINHRDMLHKNAGLDHSMITEEFRKLWPFDFSLVYTVRLTADNIETGLRVHNIGDRAFDFNTLLHTYFLIPVSNIFSHVVFR